MKRREFIQMGSLLVASQFLSLNGMNVAFASSANSKKKVIFVFLRGGCDIISALPLADRNTQVLGQSFSKLRPNTQVNTAEDILSSLKALKDASLSTDLKISRPAAKQLADLVGSLKSIMTALNCNQEQLVAKLESFVRIQNNYKKATAANHGFHPGFLPLADAIKTGEISFVLHTGSMHTTRSHFTQFDLIESGSDVSVQSTGFFGTLMNTKMKDRKAISLGEKLPHSMKGYDAALIDSMNDAQAKAKVGSKLVSQMSRSERLAMFKRSISSADALTHTATQSQTLANDLASFEAALGRADTKDNVKRRFRYASELLQTQGSVNLNPALVTIDIGGWDTHNLSGPNDYDTGLGMKFLTLSSELNQLRESLKRSGEWENTVVVVMSEFGRTIAENGSLGADHGRGSAMMLMGPGLRQDHGATKWKLDKVDDAGAGLKSAALTVETDYRDIFAQIFETHLRVANPETVFHNYVRKGRGSVFS